MGNKNRKNSNYVTEKTIQRRMQKEAAEKRKKQKRLAIIITSAVLAAAIVIGGIVALGKFVFGWGEGEYEPTATHHANIVLEGYGTLHVELYGEDAPKTVENFVKLVNEGFYNGKKFSHLMQNPENEENILIQAGEDVEGLDPIESEVTDNRISHKTGVLSAPRSALGTHPTKFFIMASSDYTDTFDGFYAAFGKVIGGLDVLEAICEDSAKSISGYDDKNLGEIAPKKQIKIVSIAIHEAH